MKNLLLFFTAAILLFSCNKGDDITSAPEDVKLKYVTAKIELPSSSSINPGSLSVSTLLTENAAVTNAEASLETFDAEAMELAYATNAQGGMVLLSYFDPLAGQPIVLNAENTAVALVLLHPWAVDLNVQAKKEAIAYIKNIPEFAALKASVEAGIGSGVLNPLSTTDVLEKIAAVQKKLPKKATLDPGIQFDVNSAKITVQNPNSSAAYCVGLYDGQGGRIDMKTVDGLSKSVSIFNNLFSGLYTFGATPKVEFKTPQGDGNYHLTAKSGLSFDGSAENEAAAIQNTRTLALNVLGIMSSKTKEIIQKLDSKCQTEIGLYVYKGTSSTVNMAQSLKDFSDKKRSGLLLMKDVGLFISEKTEGLLDILIECGGKTYLKEGALKKILERLGKASGLVDAFDGGAHLADWLQFDKKIEYCFEKKGGNITPCASIIGVWKTVSYVFCGVDLWAVPEGIVQTNCGNISGYRLCGRDNLTIYKSDSSYELNEGAISCNPPYVSEFGTYSVDAAKNIFHSATNVRSAFSGKILRLDKDTLNIQYGGGTLETLVRQ